MKAEQLLFTEATTNSTPYVEMIPIAFDDSPTFNQHAMQTLLTEYAGKRKQLMELKRQQALENKRKVLAESKRKKAVVVSRSEQPARQSYTYEATYYTAFCSTGCIGITASGYDVRNTTTYNGMRIVAAPPSIPLYSILRVHTAESSYKAIVLDRGGDITEGRLDILVGDKRTARKLGRHAVTIEILRKGAD